MRASTIFSIVMIIISVALSFYVYPSLSEPLAAHWNAYGEADGYTSRFWGLFAIPIITTILFAILTLIPKIKALSIDGLPSTEKALGERYSWFIFVMVLFMGYLHVLTIFWNFGYKFNFNQLLVPAFSLLFYTLGFLMYKIKRNRYMGIRTIWTLSNDKIWDKTHAQGSKWFKIAAITMWGGIFFPRYALWFILGPISLVVIVIIIYSYVLYKRNNQ